MPALIRQQFLFISIQWAVGVELPFFGACRSSSIDRESGTAGRKETEMYTSHKKEMKIEKNCADEGRIHLSTTPFTRPASSMWCILTFSLRMGRKVTDTGRWLKANCLPIVLCRLYITYISRFIIITKQLSDIIIKQARVLFPLSIQLAFVWAAPIPPPNMHTHAHTQLINFIFFVS